MKAIVKITDNENKQEFTLPRFGICKIGRARDNDIVLNDRRVSRYHAHIKGTEDGFLIVDGYFVGEELRRSVNQVFVNGEQVYEKVLKDGDIIKIGGSILEFSLIAEEDLPEFEKVDFDDEPLGKTQFLISAKDIMEKHAGKLADEAISVEDEIKMLQRKAEILAMFYEMSKALSSVFDLKEIFAKATDLIFRATPAERVVALLFDEKAPDKTLYPIAVKLRDEKALLSGKVVVSRTVTQKVLREKVALLSQDVYADKELAGAESIVSQGIRSTICAPLITESEIHGVIYADRLNPFELFSKEDLELITAVAAQTAIVVETVKAHQKLAQEEIIRANYGRFMPEHVVQQILKDPNSFRLGGSNQVVTVLFADIRGFTSIAENENPERIVELLNRYFTAMSEVIFSYGGTLDKYIGDGLMAIFGAPKVSPSDATNAVKCAIAMQKRLLQLNRELEKFGYKPINIGIGLHTGIATVGYVGSERRSEYTAIGDTVNLAARLEDCASAGQILISEETAKACAESFYLIPHEPLRVRNRLKPVNLFEVKWK
ncbi:MAG: adenylate cyclase [Pyrinomonadaceae bacterium]|nr:MAG: adenylate cyclase [Pyrinomonadaceae bacterium]